MSSISEDSRFQSLHCSKGVAAGLPLAGEQHFNSHVFGLDLYNITLYLCCCHSNVANETNPDVVACKKGNS